MGKGPDAILLLHHKGPILLTYNYSNCGAISQNIKSRGLKNGVRQVL